jgi:hypothetical protein
MEQEVGGRDQREGRDHPQGPVEAGRADAKVSDNFGHRCGEQQPHDPQ